MDEDIIAIRRLKSGDMGGLEALIRRYQVRAVRAAYLIVRDAATAEDVVQETFLKIFRHIQRFDETRPFEPYLLRSVVNAALDAAVPPSKREQGSVSLESVEAWLKAAETVEDQAAWNALKRDIHHALDQLNPRQRAAIVMRYYLGMSEQEMAARLDARPGTVKWLLNEARSRLRGLLERSAR